MVIYLIYGFILNRSLSNKVPLLIKRNAHIYSYVAMSREKDFSIALKECLDDICIMCELVVKL